MNRKVQEILSERESQVFQAMRYFAKRRPQVPSQAEIAAHVGCGQRTVGRAMDGLEAKGYISSEMANRNRRHRAYTIINFQRMKKNARTA